MRRSLLVVLLLTPAVLADKTEPADPNAPKAREITGVTLTPAGKPGFKARTEKITNQKDLEKVFAADAAKEIAKKVDFKKEYLVAFFWGGSGGDRLSFEVKKGEGGDVVVFTKKRGLTRDLRMHRKLFAIPARAKYKAPE
jgi:hypothetical protein